jgi:hypothetical protein
MKDRTISFLILFPPASRIFVHVETMVLYIKGVAPQGERICRGIARQISDTRHGLLLLLTPQVKDIAANANQRRDRKNHARTRSNHAGRTKTKIAFYAHPCSFYANMHARFSGLCTTLHRAIPSPYQRHPKPWSALA